MIGLVYLETSLDALDETKNNCEDQNQDSHPESVPLHAVAPVVPPLRKGPRGSVVVSLFEDHEPVSPEFELFYLARFGVQRAAFGQSAVQDTTAVLFVTLPYVVQPLLLIFFTTSQSVVIWLRE